MKEDHIEKIQILRKWLVRDPENRRPRTQKLLAIELGVSEQSLINWKKELAAGNNGGEYDSGLMLQNRSKELDEALIVACRKGDTSALRLANQLMGKLGKPKEEVDNFEPSAERISELIRIAEEEIREGDNRDPEVPTEPEVFFNELCLHSEPEYRQED